MVLVFDYTTKVVINFENANLFFKKKMPATAFFSLIIIVFIFIFVVNNKIK